MTTTNSPEQKLIDLAKWFEVPYRAADRQWCLQETEMLRAIANELAELREKAEALEWMLNKFPIFTIGIDMVDECPTIIKQIIEQKERTNG